MSALSLNASVRTCDVNTAWANRIQSDRFLNPHNMVCVPWNGMNSKGQAVCPDSFWTKTAGCNSATDRVVVENDLRPSYSEYITLNPSQGIGGHISTFQEESQQRTAMGEELQNTKPRFGVQFPAKVRYTGCTMNAYENGMSRLAKGRRGNQAAGQGMINQQYRRSAGT